MLGRLSSELCTIPPAANIIAERLIRVRLTCKTFVHASEIGNDGNKVHGFYCTLEDVGTQYMGTVHVFFL